MDITGFILNRFNLTFNDSVRLPVEIPNVGRDDLAVWLKDFGFKTGVEVGVASGEYSEKLCKNNPQMKFYGVDPYTPYKGYKDFTRKSTYAEMLRNAKKRLSKYPNYGFIQEFSLDAADKFADASLDFVYIDANHREPFISRDINKWYKKVRPGGILSGHDYTVSRKVVLDVIAAVRKFTAINRVSPWFVLGLWKRIPGTKRDESRSWVIVKKI